MQPNQENWQQPQAPRTEYHPETPVPPALSNQPEVASNIEPTLDETLQPSSQSRPSLDGEDEAVRWQAAEYVQGEKTTVWYAIFAVVVVALILLAIFVFKSWTFAVLIPVMATALAVYTLRPPATVSYTLSRQGLHINDRLHSFDEYKEFGLVREAGLNSILMVPRKRFSIGTTIYFPEEVGEQVVDMLAARLPMREIKLDPIDKLIRLLRI